MKKILLSIILLAVAGAGGWAKDRQPQKPDHRVEFSVGYALCPVLDLAMSGHLGYRYESIWGKHYTSPSVYERLYATYRGSCYLTGVVSANFSYRFKRWFALDAQLNFDAVTSSNFSSMTHEPTGSGNEYFTSLLAYARFTYCNYPKVYLYSSIGAGAGVDIYSDYVEWMPAFQVAPIGVVVGGKLYGRFELGAGTVYCGFKVGIGYRF